MSKSCLKIIISSILIFITSASQAREHNNDFNASVKVALRDVGNKVLLSNGDSTSIVLPILALEDSTFQLSFADDFGFEPKNLATTIMHSFRKSRLPNHYRVQVLNCDDKEVAYSYEIYDDPSSNVVPCSGRAMASSCYIIEVHFLENIPVLKHDQLADNHNFFYVFALVVLFLLFGLFLLKNRLATDNEKQIQTKAIGDTSYSISGIQFYPSQYKLVALNEEISLSQKECEILSIMAASPNQIITREELTTKVWENNGVIVGRSLDTYISKLRKKLASDRTARISNVHGIGYKLEVDNL